MTRDSRVRHLAEQKDRLRVCHPSRSPRGHAASTAADEALGPGGSGRGAQPCSTSKQRTGVGWWFSSFLCPGLPDFLPPVASSLALLFLSGPTQINQVVSHPSRPLTITAHDDRGIRFLDNRTGEAQPSWPPLHVCSRGAGVNRAQMADLVSTLKAQCPF